MLITEGPLRPLSARRVGGGGRTRWVPYALGGSDGVTRKFKEGDRVRYTGSSDIGTGEPTLDIPDLMPGEEGWLIDLDEDQHCWIVSWDRHGTVDMAGASDLEWLGVNEPDPRKRVTPP